MQPRASDSPSRPVICFLLYWNAIYATTVVYTVAAQGATLNCIEHKVKYLTGTGGPCVGSGACDRIQCPDFAEIGVVGIDNGLSSMVRRGAASWSSDTRVIKACEFALKVGIERLN